MNTKTTPLISDEAVRVALQGTDELGEGPHWSAAEQTLYWVDIVKPALQSVRTGDNGQLDSASWTTLDQLSVHDRHARSGIAMVY